MKQPFKKIKRGITFKLLLINGMLYIAAGVISIGIFYSYRHIETALEDVLDHHSQAMAQNAYTSKELTMLLSHTSYLVSAFYRKDQLLSKTGNELTVRLDNLQNRVQDEHLIKSLKNFNLTIRMVLEQCERINQIHRKLTSLSADFDTAIDALDKEIAVKLLDLMIQGEDVTPLQQLTTMIPELHKSFLQINFHRIDLGLEHFATDLSKKKEHPILILSDQLYLHLSSLTSPIETISGYYEHLRKIVKLYRETAELLHPTVMTFKEHQVALKQKEEDLIAQSGKIKTRMTDTMEATAKTMMSKIEKGGYIGTSAALAVLFSVSILVFLLGRTITRSINMIVKRFKEIAAGQGDLTVSLAVAGDETGALAHQFNRFMANLRKMIAEIAGNADTVNRFAGDLASVSGRMSEEVETVSSKSSRSASAAGEMSVKINTIAVTTEDINENITAISSSTEQMSQNMNSAASSIEEMNTVVSAISENSQEGAGMTASAQETAQIASDAMNELNDAVNEIGAIIDVIGKIASRTNLLALNARIEAASAGSAGKGFDVVANEIKALAIQSAEAASEVTVQIESVQKRTGNAIKVFAELSAIIRTVNSRINDISNAVRQQSQSTKEMSANMLQADVVISSISSSITDIAFKVSEMSEDAGDAAGAAVDVAKNIMAVSHVSESSNNNARKVSTSAGELAQVAAQLQKLVDQFKINEA
ncbi:methyl-accepting chemotaxis protein [Desulfococcaceae bacterium HSG9]|nr:methyl-accepting chemotaxis protein [Desulfococcaceae bacterium HSG9]